METDSVLVALGEINAHLDSVSSDMACLVTIGVILIILKILD